MKSVFKVIDEINNLNYKTFSREDILNFSASQISTDCSGLIYILQKESFPNQTFKRLKAVEYFESFPRFLKKEQIQKGIVLCWRKNQISNSGDTGHILIVTSRPKLFSELRKIEVEVFEASKKFNGPIIRSLDFFYDKSGIVNKVQWDPESRKVKCCEIRGQSLFKQIKCEQCQYKLNECLCSLLPKNNFESPHIQILQDPLETNHFKNTVKLLKLCYEDLFIEVGHHFSPRNGALIFPSSKARPITEDLLKDKELPFPLILIDGTWDKAKKILQLNSWMKDIPHYSLSFEEDSLYSHRKSKENHHYSTLEAFCKLLQLTESDREEEVNYLKSLLSKASIRYQKNLG